MEHRRITAVRIEFYLVSLRFDFHEQFWEIGMYRRFSTTDRYSIEESLACIEELEELCLSISSELQCTDFLWQDEFWIVTEITSHIASEGKYDTGDMPRIVDE